MDTVKNGRMPTKDEVKVFVAEMKEMQEKWHVLHEKIKAINTDTNAANHGNSVWHALENEIYFLRHTDEYERGRVQLRIKEAKANAKAEQKK